MGWEPGTNRWVLPEGFDRDQPPALRFLGWAGGVGFGVGKSLLVETRAVSDVFSPSNVIVCFLS